MPSYRLPPDLTLELPGCTLGAGSLTLPFPLPLEQARRLVVLATIEHTRTAENAAPLLGRCRGWVLRLWHRYGLPRWPPPCAPVAVELPLPPVDTADLDQVLARSRASACPDCQQVAHWLTGRLCLPVPIAFDEARRHLLLPVLHVAGNDRNLAAKWLGVTRRTVYAWCQRYGIPLRRRPTKPGEPAASAPRLRRGLACLPPERRRAIARLGGQRLHALGRAHRFTSEQARAAGTTGGLLVSRDREHMAELGRKGAASRLARQRGTPTPPLGDAQNASGRVGRVGEDRKAGSKRRATGRQSSAAAPRQAEETGEPPSD
jgi:general stress protein YciG